MSSEECTSLLLAQQLLGQTCWTVCCLLLNFLLLIIKCCDAHVSLQQFQMVMEVEAPHMKLNIKPEVLKMAETRWRKQAQEITVSPLHMRVAVALRDLGMSILIEHTTEDNHFSMDIALVPKDWNQVPYPPRPSPLLVVLLQLMFYSCSCGRAYHASH